MDPQTTLTSEVREKEGSLCVCVCCLCVRVFVREGCPALPTDVQWDLGFPMLSQVAIVLSSFITT